MATENELPGPGIPRIVFPIMGYTSAGAPTMTSIVGTAPNLHVTSSQSNHPTTSSVHHVPSHTGPMNSTGPFTNQTAVPLPPPPPPQPRTIPIGPFTAPVMSQSHPYPNISGLYTAPVHHHVTSYLPDVTSHKPSHHTTSAQQMASQSLTITSPLPQLPPLNTSLPGTHMSTNTHTVTSTHTGNGNQEGSSSHEGCNSLATCPLVTSILPFSSALAVPSTTAVSSSPSVKIKGKMVTTSLPSSPSLEDVTVSKPVNEKQNFTNEIARELFDEEFKKFNGTAEFKTYVTEQQRWRWETHHSVTTLETRVKNMTCNPNSGVAQNVTRYKTIPTNSKSEDVKRCEMTVVTMDAMATRVATLRTELLHRKNNLLARNMTLEPCHNEFRFLEKCFSRVDTMYTGLITLRACVNQTLAHLRENFTQESAAAAEIRRLKRRKKENLRKKRKRREQTLEKRACEILLKITQSGVLERVWSNPGGQRVSANELLHNPLDALKSINDVEALKLIISRGYLDPSAVEVVSRKMILLQNGVK